MKELMATARNLSLTVDADDLREVIEIALTVSEPAFEADAGGEVVRRRVAETIRFSTNVDGLRLLASRCEEWAKEAEALRDRVTVEQSGEKP